MKDQHRAITGYRELSAVDIALMNEIKAYTAEGQVLADKIHRHVNAQFEATKLYVSVEEEEKRIAALPEEQRDIPTGLVQTEEAKAEWQRIIDAEPYRWISIGKTDVQTAGMAFARAVAQPTTF